MERYGRPISEWNQAKQEAEAILREVARAEATISYSDLAAKIRAVSFEPDEYGYHAFLGEISESEDDGLFAVSCG